jgi:Na+/H+ antiporter NhaA
VKSTVSPNERIQHALHPWTSYVIVPLFAFANAGIRLDGQTLREAATSPVTLGIVTALVVGKSVGITGSTLLALRLRLGVLPGASGAASWSAARRWPGSASPWRCS